MACPHFHRHEIITHMFVLFFARLYVTFDKLLRLRRKNKQVCFVLLSTFRNFSYAELTMHSEKLK